MTTQEIRKKIEDLIDESTNQTLKQANAIKHIGVDSDKNSVVLIIQIGKQNSDAEKNLRRELAKIVKLDLGFSGIKIQFEEAKKQVGTNAKYFIIGSGKGGVGKTYITANIAYALARANKKVAIIDCDIYGSSIPQALELPITDPIINDQKKIVPYKTKGIEVISTAFFAEQGQPILWRGNMLKSMVNSFFSQVAWDKEIEYVLIDTPTGTGDVMIDLKSFVPQAEVILVTTPHQAVSDVVAKTGKGFKELNHNLVGVIENMSYYYSNNQTQYPFGSGGADAVADILKTEVIAKIPIQLPKNHFGLYESDEEVGRIYDDLAALLSIR